MGIQTRLLMQILRQLNEVLLGEMFKNSICRSEVSTCFVCQHAILPLYEALCVALVFLIKSSQDFTAELFLRCCFNAYLGHKAIHDEIRAKLPFFSGWMEASICFRIISFFGKSSPFCLLITSLSLTLLVSHNIHYISCVRTFWFALVLATVEFHSHVVDPLEADQKMGPASHK